MRRLLLVAALLALAVPTGGRAEAKSFAPPYAAGPQGGDQFNYINADGSTGSMTVLRYNPTPVNGGLGCGGTGGYANFAVDYVAESAASVTVSFNTGIVDPYTWVKVGVRQGDHFLATNDLRGPVLGDGAVTVPLGGASGPLTVWFGLQVASACPNVDGGHVTFTSVAFA